MSDWRPLAEVLPVVDTHAAYTATSRQPQSQAQPPPHAQPAAHMPASGPKTDTQAGMGAQANSEAEGLGNSSTTAQDCDRALSRAESEALGLRYRAAVEDLVTAREHVIRGAETDLVRLALTIAREVLMADVPGREQFTAKMAEHALGLLGQSDTLTLRVNAHDLAALRQYKPELLRRQGLTLVEDPSLAEGGVIAEGMQGRVDASLSERLAAMSKKLLAEGGATT